MRYPLAAAAAALALSASAAGANTIVALSGESTLATIDATSGKVIATAKIQGLGPVLGIDVRPSDGMLYALASDGTVATIDLRSGKATPRAKLDTMPPGGVRVTVDFNPVADKMRIIGADGTNLRANVDDGKVTKDQPLKFAETDAASGKAPMIVAGGYTNSMKGAKETTLYDVDGKLGGLFRQAPPNDGILSTIGVLGVQGQSISFDIVTDSAGANMAMLLSGKRLYSVDLASGKAVATKDIAGLPGNVSDIAVLPAL
jgi:DNA-binding beta-propeller fold protein YncE